MKILDESRLSSAVLDRQSARNHSRSAFPTQKNRMGSRGEQLPPNVLELADRIARSLSGEANEFKKDITNSNVFHETNDQLEAELKAALLESHLPLVRMVVSSMKTHFPSHADLEELLSIGVLGLLDAIEKYDESKGKTFRTYASIRIRGAILDELRRMDWMPRSVRNKDRWLKETVKTLEQQLGRAPKDPEIREALGLSEKQYRKLRFETEPIQIVFLDSQETTADSNLHETIHDERQVPCYEEMEKSELMDLLDEKLDELPENQKNVLEMYYHGGMKLAEIAESFGLTEARISQIHTQGIIALRRCFRAVA